MNRNSKNSKKVVDKKQVFIPISFRLPETNMKDIDFLCNRLGKNRTELFVLAIQKFIDYSRTTDSESVLISKNVTEKPNVYTPELGYLIYEKLCTPVLDMEYNKSIYPALSQICLDPKMPSLPTLLKWKEEIPEFAGFLDLASKVLAHTVMDQLTLLLQIIDNNNADSVSTTVSTIVSTLLKIAPTILNPSNALRQALEEGVVINVNLIEKPVEQ